MDIVPVETGGILTFITEKSSLVAFELFVIILLCLVVKTLYARNVKQGDDNSKALIDSTLAINNNTLALNALMRQIERINNVR